MEFERIIPNVRRPIDEEKLLAYCRKFADVLTGRSWQLNDVLGAHVQREIKRMVVAEESIGDSRLHSAGVQRVTIDFWADKDEVDFDDEDSALKYEEHYTLSVALSEEVSSVELPDWVLKTLLNNSAFQKHSEMYGDPDVLEDAIDPELDLEILDSFTYDKSTVMRYCIDEDGLIEDFGITCRYECNGQVLDMREYSWSDTVIEAIGTSLWTDDIESEEETPQLSESEIVEFQAQFDMVMQRIVADDERNQIDEQFSQLESEELDNEHTQNWQLHYTRAFGMLALNADRFIGMRIK